MAADIISCFFLSYMWKNKGFKIIIEEIIKNNFRNKKIIGS